MPGAIPAGLSVDWFMQRCSEYPPQPACKEVYVLPYSLKAHENRLLAMLPKVVKRRIFPQLELVDLTVGEVICESYMKMTHVYFPVDALLSTLYEMEDGESVEISIVGNDGFVGSAIVLGGETSPNRTVVQCAGRAYRLKHQLAKAEFDRHAEVYTLFLSYIQILMIQSSQTALCYRHHTVEQQLCRWLLLSVDRLSSNSLRMTQQLIANNLGVRREGVTHAARRLQKLGLISYHRGGITVVDRDGVMQRSCECYDIVKRESDRLMSRLPLLRGRA